jgi:hypothetical protein
VSIIQGKSRIASDSCHSRTSIPLAIGKGA